MGVSKVVYGNDTVIDLTGDTITADRLCAGCTAHGADGEAIMGTLKTATLEPYIEELNCGWVGPGTGVWTPENPTLTYADIYEVKGEHSYLVGWGANTGTRGRIMFTTEDVSKATGKVNGTAVNTKGYDNPVAYTVLKYTPETDGYIVIAKDNVGKTGIKTYVYDMTEGWI